MQDRLRLAMGAVAIIVVALAMYRGLLFGDPAVRYPWSSDTYGHLIKVEFLYAQIHAGNLYPDIFPAWYNGVQMLRYYAPLPYYIMVSILALVGDIFLTGNLFLLLVSLVGGLSFLLYRSRFGLLSCTVGGVLFMLIPDNLRVAFAEGNLPRVLATALLPATVYFVLNVMERGGRFRDLLGLVVLMSLIVLSHAMMAAIFVVCLSLFAFFYWIGRRAGARSAGAAILGVLTGVLLAGWWLFPSLTGGITELNQQAASEALAYFPLTVSLNPSLRQFDKEIFYVGASFVLALVLILWRWQQQTPLTKSLLITGLLTALLSSTIMNDVYHALPMHHLFWPLRFMSFASLALLLAAMSFGAWLLQSSRARAHRAYRFVFLGLVLAMVVDFYPSTGLMFGREQPEDLVQIAQEMPQLPGWRVALADFSMLGSAPSYLLTALGGREQVHGWAYQGAATAPVVASVNFAIEQGHQGYALDRLTLLGADDILVLNTAKIPMDFRLALERAGYELRWRGQRLDLYHRDGGPRAYPLNYDILGIGEGAQNLAFLFPEVTVASSPMVDDYELAFLSRYRQVVLSRFSWRNRALAEGLVAQYVAQGGKVLVDLTGSPEDPLSREPKFLGVYGEPVILHHEVTMEQGNQRIPLLPFRGDYFPWLSHSPQGLDENLVTFDYVGQEGVILGYKNLAGGRVDFLGLNLIFHAALTRDLAAIRLLEQMLGIPQGGTPVRQAVPLSEYQADQRGYSAVYSLPTAEYLLVPVAHHPGSAVFLDGLEVGAVAINNLVAVPAPPGRHRLEVTARVTAAHLTGWAATAAATLALILYLVGLVPRPGPAPVRKAVPALEGASEP